MSYRLGLTLLCIQADGRQQMDTFRTTPIKQTLWQQRQQSKARITFAATRSDKAEWFIYAVHGCVSHLSPPVSDANFETLTWVSTAPTLPIAAVSTATTLLHKRVMLRADGTNSLTVATGDMWGADNNILTLSSSQSERRHLNTFVAQGLFPQSCRMIGAFHTFTYCGQSFSSKSNVVLPTFNQTSPGQSTPQQRLKQSRWFTHFELRCDQQTLGIR